MLESSCKKYDFICIIIVTLNVHFSTLYTLK